MLQAWTAWTSRTHSALDGREEGALVMLDLRARLAVRDDPC